MSTSAKTLFFFGLYLVGMGVSFVLAPNVLLGLFGLPQTDEVWIRVVGMLALILAFYYILAARAGLRIFIQWTVYARAAVILFFAAFVLAGWASPMLILFGAVDLLAALWTRWALRKEENEAAPVSEAVAG